MKVQERRQQRLNIRNRGLWANLLDKLSYIMCKSVCVRLCCNQNFPYNKEFTSKFKLCKDEYRASKDDDVETPSNYVE